MEAEAQDPPWPVLRRLKGMEKDGQEVGGKSHITRVRRNPKTDCAGGVEQRGQLRNGAEDQSRTDDTRIFSLPNRPLPCVLTLKSVFSHFHTTTVSCSNCLSLLSGYPQSISKLLAKSGSTSCHQPPVTANTNAFSPNHHPARGLRIR
jgi:hypothetical protein